jgi:hypothetical protein
MEAAHFAKALGNKEVVWTILPGHGLSQSGVTSFPVEMASITPSANSPRLEYRFHLFSTGEAAVNLLFSPSLNFQPGRGLRVAVSMDEEKPLVIDILAADTLQDWERSVIKGVRRVVSKHRIDRPGTHTLKVWLVDPAVVLQRVIVDMGGLRPSVLGPTESPRN